MNKETFVAQIARLAQTWGKEKYPQERTGLLWRSFEKVPDEIFVDAVDELIANERSAPLADEIEKAVIQARARAHEQTKRLTQSAGVGGFIDVMQESADKSRSEETKEFARRCIKLVTDLMNNRISMQHFQQGCDLLDQAAKLMEDRKCPRCGGSGLIRKQNEVYSYLYRCNCSAGRMQPEEISAKQKDGNIITAKIPFVPFGMKGAEC